MLSNLTLDGQFREMTKNSKNRKDGGKRQITGKNGHLL
jgi:hypothetical protein